MKKILNIIIIVIIFQVSGFSQSGKSKLDSMLSVLKTCKEDTSKAKLLNDLGMMLYQSNQDSAILFSSQALILSQKLKFRKEEARSYKVIGIGYFLKDKFENALTNYFLALKISEEIKDYKNSMSLYNNIGLIYLKITRNKDACEIFKKALVLSQKLKDKNRESSILLNLGAVYDRMDSTETSLKCYNLSLEIRKEMNDKEGIGSCSNNVGNILLKQKKYQKALPYFLKACELLEKDQNFYNLTTIYTNTARTYLNLGNFESSKKYLILADSASRKSESEGMIIESQFAWYQYYSKIKDFKKALEYHEKYTLLTDSVFSRESSKQVTEMQTKYETEKKEKENELLREKESKSNILIQKQQAEKQRLLAFILAAFISITLLIITAVILIRNNKIKQETNNKLHRKNTEILQQKEEILTQNESLQQQKEEIMSQAESLELANFRMSQQKNELQKSHEQIKASINYAYKIQTAMLPERELFKKYFADYFIFYKPKDVVSGDFFWLKKVNDFLIFAVADCTGHGVPGAFVSMLAISLLNEIVQRREVSKASDVLDLLRLEIKYSLKQTGTAFESKDGLDIALCALNLNTLQLQYSGANNSLFIIKNNVNNEIILEEIKANRQPIGIYLTESPFTNHEIQLNKGDKLYMLSDGYIDQFSSSNGQKFKINNFRNLISNICKNNFDNQGKIIENTFTNWQGSEKQIDDVLVAGFEI